jgi:hypothetical protein
MKVKILSVKAVSGRTLNPNWKSAMQKISTNKGEYIDNSVDSSYSPGHDWSSEIGSYVDADINNSRGYKWLSFNYTSNNSSSSNKLKILKVTRVPGSTLKPYWKGDMQEIKTNQGKYIDSYDNCDWSDYIGCPLDDDYYYIKNSAGYEWLQKS